MDESYGLLYLSISLDLVFHLDVLNTPNQVWTKLESLFGVKDEIRAHQLDNELISLSPNNFEYMEGFFTNLKPLILMLKQCGIEKKDYQMIISILSKLSLEYLVFVSTFHATRIVILNWKMASFSTFIDSLTKEKDKLVHMGENAILFLFKE